jgi:hypothetical protein
MGKKGSGKKPATKEVKVKKEKGPKPDYKIPKLSRDVFKDIYPATLEQARAQLIAAKAKDKWIYEVAYQVLKQEKHNGGVMTIKHNSNQDK